MSEKTSGKRYVVKHSLVGAFPKGHVFDQNEFVRLNPVPDGEDRAEYVEQSINRLLELGAIAPSHEEAKPTPGGPENRPGQTGKAPAPTRPDQAGKPQMPDGEDNPTEGARQGQTADNPRVEFKGKADAKK